MADISKINAVLIANIAEIDDVLAANIAKVNGLVFSTAPAFTGLLDTYTGAAAAYSTRRLYGQYTGAALRVREDSGDTETDIGFDSNGDLDTAAIATHCGSANGYVTKWYGQESSGGTGSGNDATQTTSGSQPQIYDGSAVITENGKPAMDSNRDFFDITDITSISAYSCIAVMTDGIGDVAPFGENTGSATYITWKSSATSMQFRHGGSPNQNVSLSYTLPTSQRLDWYNWSGTTVGFGYNGSAFDTATLAGTPEIHVILSGHPTLQLVGKAQEMLIWTSDNSSNRSGIEGNLNAHYQIGNFGTPTSGLLYDYSGAAAAYSVRQLANTAALAMRIREDGTDTETDIGFDSNGDLDTAAIASHCGANNGYVVTWYDQSGNQVDATQSTTTAQPQIYNGSAVLTLNGKPIVTVSGVNIALQASVPSTFNKDLSIFSVSKFDASLSYSGVVGNATFFTARNGNTGSIFENWSTAPSGFINGASFTGNQDNLYDNHLNSQRLYTGIDGRESTTTLYVATNPASNFFQGYDVQEWIMFEDTDPSNRGGIETNINSEYLIYQPTDAPTSGLLATYTGAAAAYSVRQLSDKAVIAMRIRRDSDDAEINIGFDSNGDLDTTAISDFCSTANGYVVEWADQSTNGNHASQSTSTRQPQIYNGTAVITENGKPAPQFTGDYFNLSLTNTASNYSLHVVTQNSSTDSFLFDSYTGRLVFDGRGGTRGVYYDGSWKGTMHSGTGQQLQSIYAISSSSGQSYVDGSQINTGLSYTQTAIGGNVTLGCEQTGTAFHISGTIQEFILYASDETSNRTGIETNINNYFSIY